MTEVSLCLLSMCSFIVFGCKGISASGYVNHMMVRNNSLKCCSKLSLNLSVIIRSSLGDVALDNSFVCVVCVCVCVRVV